MEDYINWIKSIGVKSTANYNYYTYTIIGDIDLYNKICKYYELEYIQIRKDILEATHENFKLRLIKGCEIEYCENRPAYSHIVGFVDA